MATDGYTDIHDNVRYWLGLLLEGREGTFYDIGANDGVLAVPIAAAGYPVVAFEPGRAAGARLLARAGEAGVTATTISATDTTASSTDARLRLVPLALGAASERGELLVFADDTFSSLHARSEEERARYELATPEAEPVRIEPLDAVVQSYRLGAPAVCKIDVEGAERDVLDGARRTLAAALPPLLFEFSCINTANAGYERSELVDRVREIGYRFVWGLYRNEDRRLYGGRALADCRIWNLVALADGDPALERAREHLGGELLPPAV